MNFISSSQTPQAVNSGFRVDISRGQRIGFGRRWEQEGARAPSR